MSAKRRVLLIDDDPMQLELLSRSLGYEGFEVHTLSDPKQAEDTVRNLVPDFVLLDLNIPGVTGSALIEAVRAVAGDSTRVYIMSAADESKLRTLAANAKAHGYISKSMSSSDIAKKLKSS